MTPETTEVLGIMREAVDDLIFASYRAQRLQFPEVSAERWAAIFPQAKPMEVRFQREYGRILSARVAAQMNGQGDGEPMEDQFSEDYAEGE